jgi:radical SAM protein with 4Fe4S-binding SPASM domain
MPVELSDKILLDTAANPQIDNVAFSGLSEPLLDKHLEQRIAYIKKLRPDIYTEVYTNGVALRPTRFDSLKAAGLDCLSVSLNAVNQEQHYAVMKLKDQYARVCEHINYARANKGSMRMLVKAVVNGDSFTAGHAVLFTGLWGQIDVGEGVGALVWQGNWANEIETIEGRPEVDYNATCGRAMAQISVHPNGKVGLCCFDPLVKYEFGDLKTQSLKEVYNSPKYVEFREWHRDGVAAKHPLCAVCTRI